MHSISLPLLLAVLAPQAGPDGEAPRAKLAPPVQLMAGDEPMGHAQMYPSPALFDLDGDGSSEMVVGDLLGNLMVSKRVEGGDQLAWTKVEPLAGADKKPLKFNNW